MSLLILLQVWLASSLLMIFGWLVAVYRQRAEVVDVLWSLGTGVSGVYLAYSLEGNLERRVLLGFLTGFWGIRLAFHLFKDRFLARHEDGRYKDLRLEWKELTNKKLFIFFQLQAFLIPLLATSFFAVATNTRQLMWFDYLSLALAFFSVAGETISDRQLKKFKSKQAPESLQICEEGLWKYSRHPNYFFEWLYWLSFPILAYGSDYFLLVFISPIIMYYLIRHVTGIVPTEARMLQKRGAIFADYQKRVSPFFFIAS